LNIKQVEADKDYAILLSTCSGTWRYLIGDTIRFVDLDHCEIKITGRVKHFLSLCGEHLSVDNMNSAISMLSDHLNIPINEFTVKGLTEHNKHSHHWYLACDNTNLDIKTVTNLLDQFLCSVNDDYATERKHALKEIKVTLLPGDKFIGWMQEQGKFGSQNKFPRVLTNAKYKEWLEYLEKTPIVN
jgi:hypothetical protein